MKAEGGAPAIRHFEHRGSRSIDKIFCASLKLFGKRSFDLQFAVACLIQAHDVTDIGEGQQAAERVITVRTWRPDVQVKVDLGRREAEAIARGWCQDPLDGVSIGPSPFFSFASTSVLSLTSGSSVSTRLHWYLASIRRPTRQ